MPAESTQPAITEKREKDTHKFLDWEKMPAESAQPAITVLANLDKQFRYGDRAGYLARFYCSQTSGPVDIVTLTQGRESAGDS